MTTTNPTDLVAQLRALSTERLRLQLVVQYRAPVANVRNAMGALQRVENRMMDLVPALLTAIEQGQGRVEAMEEALKPFVAQYVDYDVADANIFPDASSLPEVNELTIGDLRRASEAYHAALHETQQPE